MSALGLKYEILTKIHSALGFFYNNLIPVSLEASILFAVPKQKVTHSRKRMRMATKQLRNLQNVTKCPKCGEPKLLHNLCWKCYGDFKLLSKSQ